MNDILFLKPVLQEKIWGGIRLVEEYGMELAGQNIGEAWVVSAHANGDCEIINGEYAGKKFSKVWENNPELFGYKGKKEFPLLVKIIDAKDDLSVQVHPGDDYARKYENSLGKTEAWYVLGGDKLVLGHKALTKEELVEAVSCGEFENLLTEVKIKPGDFHYINAGDIHAICANSLIYEIQQSSDITYRIYDYERVDDTGQKRELHVNKAIDCITIPHSDYVIEKNEEEIDGNKITKLADEKYFSITKINVKNSINISKNSGYLIVGILEGNGKVNGYDVKKGDHFIVTAGIDSIDISGNDLELMIVEEN